MSMLNAQARRLLEWERYLRDKTDDQYGIEMGLNVGNARAIADELRDAADTIEELRGKLQGNDAGEVGA